MSTLITVFIAIVLFSSLSIAALSYIDFEGSQAGVDAGAIAAQLSDLTEASRRFETQRGVFPVSMVDLGSEIDAPSMLLPETRNLVSNGFACVTLPLSRQNEQTLIIARKNFVGPVAVAPFPADVSDRCGSLIYSDRIVLAVALDGITAAPAGGYILP